jgi:hypothetical protein
MYLIHSFIHSFTWLCPQVAEEVESQLQKYKAAVDEINSKTAGAGGDDALMDHEELLRRNTQNLMSAVSSLPELQVGLAFLCRVLSSSSVVMLQCCWWVIIQSCAAAKKLVFPALLSASMC